MTAVAIKTHDGGPVLYRQTRSGRDGRVFGCYKFRSMVVDAEAALPAVANQHGEDHVLFKSRADPRITRPGRFIRRYSIDELSHSGEPEGRLEVFGDKTPQAPQDQHGQPPSGHRTGRSPSA
jgi:hypothetical protein